jgi:uncharacterized protein (TIGR01777 family)
MKVFVTGATGLVGSRLVRALLARGATAVPLSRNPIPPDRFGPGAEPVVGDPADPGPWQDVLAGCDAVVHHAGENIFAKRWTESFLKAVRDSRVNGTALVAEALSRQPRRADGSPKVLISASAVGYYGDRGDEVMTETSAPAADFMAKLTADWEAAAAPARAAGVRVVHPRLGIVLDPDGGALPKLVLPFKLFAGGSVGSGNQWVSWIHRDDMTALLLFLLDTAAAPGPVNAVAPNPVRNRDLGKALGRALGRPSWLPVPRFALRVALGKVAEVLTGGQRVLPEKALGLGFSFRFPDIDGALKDLLGERRG